MSTWIVFSLLFLLSFIVFPFGQTDFETLKIILAEAGIIILCRWSFFRPFSNISLKNLHTIFVVTLMILTIIDLLFFNSSIVFFGNTYRMQGIFLFWLLMIFSIISQYTDLKKIHWMIFVGVLIVQFVLLFFFGQNESGRFIGSFGEPNALAAFALFVWPFAFFHIKKFGKKEFIAMSVVLLIVPGIIFFSGSRSAIIGFGIQLFLLLSLKFEKAKTKILFLCLVIYLASYITPFIFQTTYENRAEIWHAAVNAFLERPILGYGFGNTETALHNSAHQLGLPVQYYYVDSSHNIFFDFAVSGGIIGLACIGGLVVISIKNFIIKHNTRNLTIFIGLITVLSFNPASIVGLLGFWWLLGQGFEIQKFDKMK